MNVLTMPKTQNNTIDTTEQISIKELVASAADVVAPVWPLKTFIAVNPLQGLENLPFEQAVLEAERHRAINGSDLSGRESVNRELIKWCSAFFDDGQATIAMPGRVRGLYRAFADLARYDGRLNRSKAGGMPRSTRHSGITARGLHPAGAGGAAGLGRLRQMERVLAGSQREPEATRNTGRLRGRPTDSHLPPLARG
jgi:hypothetical protein